MQSPTIFYFLQLNLTLLENLITLPTTVQVYQFAGLQFFTHTTFYQFPLNVVSIFMVKFLIISNFLVVIRGGTPRYRYDYLTKLGWLKFLNFVLLMFFFAIFFFFLF